MDVHSAKAGSVGRNRCQGQFTLPSPSGWMRSKHTAHSSGLASWRPLTRCQECDAGGYCCGLARRNSAAAAAAAATRVPPRLAVYHLCVHTCILHGKKLCAMLAAECEGMHWMRLLVAARQDQVRWGVWWYRGGTGRLT